MDDEEAWRSTVLDKLASIEHRLNAMEAERRLMAIDGMLRALMADVQRITGKPLREE